MTQPSSHSQNKLVFGLPESMCTIELIASDMDGTFLDADHNVSDAVLDAVNRLESHTDILICPATGRSRMSALKKLATKGIEWSNRPGVYLNGAIVYGPSGEVLYENTFRMDILEALISEFEDDTSVAVVMPCSGDTTHAPQICEISLHLHTDYADPYPANHAGYKQMRDRLPDLKVHMVAVMTKDCRASEDQVFERVKRIVSRFGSLDEFSVVRPIPRMISIMPRNTSKGTGLLALCKGLSICPSRVAALGDAGNDIEMLRMVGCGVAMGNAKDEVKMHAKLVVNRNDHAEMPGVAQFIHHVIDRSPMKQV